MAEVKRKADGAPAEYLASNTEPVQGKQTKIQKTSADAGVSVHPTTPLVNANYTTNPAFLLALLHTPVEALKPASNTVLVAQRTDLLSDVWKGLIKNNFLSCPVLQKTKKKYYGFIDLHDIVEYITQKFDVAKLESSKDFWQLMEADKEFLNTTVDKVIVNPIVKRNPYHPVTVGYSLFSAIESLAREDTLHRVPVIDKDRQLKSLLTQSQVIDFVVSNLESVGSIKNKPVSQVVAGRPNVLSVTTKMSAIEAFKFMAQHNITGVAVLDDNGKLIDAMSLSDLKLISSDGQMFWRLYQSVDVFLGHLRENNATRKLIYCLPTHNLEYVIKTIATSKVHRIFVGNAQTFLSLKDILKELIT
eukprot:TRINITY_DN1869_c0_g1_i1.p1 TRINITY_DN1869_c0_g1~~TRINITY_DN1869_c0_g1_i1.p1  ORF type:complete len:360 (+),score=80.83 TRINITY_DN1869_c0_g1_i1:204-1283(+)